MIRKVVAFVFWEWEFHRKFDLKFASILGRSLILNILNIDQVYEERLSYWTSTDLHY